MTVAGTTARGLLSTDPHASRRDHVTAELRIVSAVARSRIGDGSAGVVGIARRGATRFVRPTSDIVLPIPVIIASRPDHERNVPSVPPRQGPMEIRARSQAV